MDRHTCEGLHIACMQLTTSDQGPPCRLRISFAGSVCCSSAGCVSLPQLLALEIRLDAGLGSLIKPCSHGENWLDSSAGLPNGILKAVVGLQVCGLMSAGPECDLGLIPSQAPYCPKSGMHCELLAICHCSEAAHCLKKNAAPTRYTLKDCKLPSVATYTHALYSCVPPLPLTAPLQHPETRHTHST